MYTIRIDDNYNDVLQENGTDKICPFQTPVAVPMQNAIGQMTMTLMRMPCSSVCPFVDIVEINGEEIYFIKCTGSEISFDIEKKQNPLIKL